MKENYPWIFGGLGLLLSACSGDPPAGLGVRDARLQPCPNRPNCVSSQAEAPTNRIASFPITGESDDAFSRLHEVLSERPDTRITSSGVDYLRVEFRTRFGFVDDGEFYLDRTAHVIHVRSASRIGYSDLGKNRSRIEEIRKAYAAR